MGVERRDVRPILEPTDVLSYVGLEGFPVTGVDALPLWGRVEVVESGILKQDEYASGCFRAQLTYRVGRLLICKILLCFYWGVGRACQGSR